MLAAICAGAVAATLAAGPGAARDVVLRADARFAPPTAFVPSDAVTYDQDLVPAGASIEVVQRTTPGGATVVTLRVGGLPSGRAFGAHVHQKACGADPAAAGGHYQHVPGTGPEHVDAENEVWLDFTTGDAGSGVGVAVHPWTFRPGEAASVVIHDEPGLKGKRVGCFTVPFTWTDAS
ncbi:superoxide dismutase family protein [Streptomyces roseirectus]|uniref:Superoxide dismutase family protein n=1 Tax=Streptomyces roseirectus TaxID=2768066 RepID=A0A7H0IJJ6_9ACTN|nr:superoxide dismutase family protein [Streptomyces roseirectus]QNP72962.1 superoxide dismutase family protein [Streptomyces roseirectus]